MKIKDNVISFGVKLPSDADWTEVKISLGDLKQDNFTCDESLAINIMEYIYATDDRFYKQEDELLFNVNNYWNDIVVPAHESIYRKRTERSIHLFGRGYPLL